MATATPATDALRVPFQTGKALIGWMTGDQAILWLSGRRADTQNREELQLRAQNARTAVAARPVGIDQSNIRTPAPAELDAHIDALRQNASGVQLFNEGWQVSIIDLSRVCAAQPFINTGSAIQRVDRVEAGDLASLAAVSLPVAAPTAFPVAFDPSKNTWIFSSPNPNLRVAGRFNVQAQPGQNVFGFVVGLSTSFLQAAVYRDRYMLRDGYHRAFGFLARGITNVPAFVREFQTYEELTLPAGMLPQEAFLGERPPTLRDYLDETVSAEIQIPVTQKVVVVQASEFSTLS